MQEIKLIVIEQSDKEITKQLKQNKEVLKELREENRKKRSIGRTVRNITCVLVISLAILLGIIAGRAWAFLIVMGC